MARLEKAKVTVKEIDPKFLSVIFDRKTSKEALKEKERSKLEVFERGLANEISTSDTIEKTVEKMVKMALVCEFGASLVTKAAAKPMIEVISRGILSDRELRRSALIIADMYAGRQKKSVSIRGNRKTIMNG